MSTQLPLNDRLRGYSEDKEYNRTPLMWAVRWQDAEAFRHILGQLSGPELQAELDREDSFFGTPLHLACMVRDLEIATLLLEAGANPNAISSRGDSVLCRAVETTDIAFVHLLLKHGASVEGNDKDALETARMYGLVQIVELLEQPNRVI